MTMDAAAGPQGVKSAERTLDVLELLASSERPLTLSDIPRALDAPKSSLHKLLGTMERRHWVEIDELSHTRYRIGLHALLIGTRYVDGDEVVQLIQPLLAAVTEELQEASHLGRLDGSDIVYLAKRDSPHPLRMFSAVGRRLPAHATAMGKAILAGMPWEDVDALLPHRLLQLTPRTIATRAELKEELDRVREQGFAVDDEESAEMMRAVAIALPGFGTRNAISVSAPAVRLPQDDLQHHAQVLRTLAARQLSTERR